MRSLREARVSRHKKVFLITCAAFFLLWNGVFVLGTLFGKAPAPSAVSTTGTMHPAIPWFYGLAKYGWCILLTATLVYPLVKGHAKSYFRYFREIRPFIVAQNVGVVAVVLATAYGLYRFVPFLNRSWLYLFPIMDGHAGNIGLIPVSIKYFSLMFVALLVLNLPGLAYAEEKKYRYGTRNWKQGVVRSVRFGLAHCIVGVPIYIGLALSVGGLWFTYQYLRGGVDRSTTHHLTYNLIVVTALTIFLIVTRVAF